MQQTNLFDYSPFLIGCNCPSYKWIIDICIIGILYLPVSTKSAIYTFAISSEIKTSETWFVRQRITFIFFLSDREFVLRQHNIGNYYIFINERTFVGYSSTGGNMLTIWSSLGFLHLSQSHFRRGCFNKSFRWCLLIFTPFLQLHSENWDDLGFKTRSIFTIVGFEKVNILDCPETGLSKPFPSI